MQSYNSQRAGQAGGSSSSTAGSVKNGVTVSATLIDAAMGAGAGYAGGESPTSTVGPGRHNVHRDKLSRGVTSHYIQQKNMLAKLVADS